MNSIDLGYIAGMVDGEGCIHITKYLPKNYKNFSYTLIVEISNTNIEALQHIQSLIGYGTIKENRRTDKPSHWKRTYSYCLRAKQALSFLVLIEPHLIIKKEQARIGIKFQSMPYTNNGMRGVSEDYIIEREMYYTQMRGMK